MTRALSVNVQGFKVSADGERVQLENGMWVAHDLQFSIAGIGIKRRAKEAPGEATLDLTVSVRPGERLDTGGPPLPDYVDTMLTGVTTFPVQGLTRDELAAEKILGYTSTKPSAQALR